MDAIALGLRVLSSPALLGVIATLARLLLRRTHTRITCAHTAANAAVLQACPSMHRYAATPWLPSAHMNTLFGTICRASPSLCYTRVPLCVRDGGHVHMDWHARPRPRQPVLMLLHGLTGGSEERYIQWAIKAVSERTGMACVVLNARGCGKSSLTSPRCFSAAWTHDLRIGVQYVRHVVGEGVPIFAVGFSLGAGVLSKYLVEEGPSCDLAAAVMCCASLDMLKSTALLESWFMKRTYNKVLTRNLIAYLERHSHHFTDVPWFDSARARAARSVREFDASTIVPMFGYDDVWQYYRDASTAPLIGNIGVPALYLNAADDPICSSDGLPLDRIPDNPNIISVLTPEGGHVAWCQGWWPRTFSWDNDVLAEYLQAQLRMQGYIWSRSLADDAERIHDALDVSPAQADTAGVLAAAAGAASGDREAAAGRAGAAAEKREPEVVSADAEAASEHGGRPGHFEA